MRSVLLFNLVGVLLTFYIPLSAFAVDRAQWPREIVSGSSDVSRIEPPIGVSSRSHSNAPSYLPLKIALVASISPIGLLIFLYLITWFSQSQFQEIDEGPLLQRVHNLSLASGLKVAPVLLVWRPRNRRNYRLVRATRRNLFLAREVVNSFPTAEVDALLERDLNYLSRATGTWRASLLGAIGTGLNVLGFVALFMTTGVWDVHGLSPILMFPIGAAVSFSVAGVALGCWNERWRERRADECIDARLVPEIVRSIVRISETGSPGWWEVLLPRWARPYHMPSERVGHLRAYHGISPDSCPALARDLPGEPYPLPSRLLQKSASSDLHELSVSLLVVIPLIPTILLIQGSTVTGDLFPAGNLASYGIALSVGVVLVLLALCVKDYAWNALRRWTIRCRVERECQVIEREKACAIVGFNPVGLQRVFGSFGRPIWDAGWLGLSNSGIHYWSTVIKYTIAWSDVTDIRRGALYLGVCPYPVTRILWTDSHSNEREIVVYFMAFTSKLENGGEAAFHDLVVRWWKSESASNLEFPEKTSFSLQLGNSPSAPMSTIVTLASGLVMSGYFPLWLCLAGFPALGPLHTAALGAYLPAAVAVVVHSVATCICTWRAQRR